VSADSADRTASHAKTLDLDQQQTALDRRAQLREAFDRAQAAKLKSQEQQQPKAEAKELGNSHAPRPEPHLKPIGEIRRAVDREIDNEKMQREAERSKAITEAFRERAMQQRLRESELNHDRDR
jgi:hypothetical protein